MLFNKLKSLFPVFVIAWAVIVTIKLLTTVTPENQELIQVKAEEDIRTEEYTDPIEEPPVPPEPEMPEEKEVASEKEQAPEEDQEDNDDEAEEEGGEEREEEQEKQEKETKEEKKEEKKPPVTLKWNGSAMATTLSKLLGSKN